MVFTNKHELQTCRKPGFSPRVKKGFPVSTFLKPILGGPGGGSFWPTAKEVCLKFAMGLDSHENIRKLGFKYVWNGGSKKYGQNMDFTSKKFEFYQQELSVSQQI